MNPNPWSRRARRALLIVLATLAATTTASAEWKEQVLYDFQGGTSDGYYPAGGVIFGKAGNLYGATSGGGPGSCAPYSNACGTVFQLSPSAKKGGPWTETILYQFKGKESNDASVPTSGLITDNAGNLYGVTGFGGTGDCVLLGVSAGCGTVYEISPPKQKGGQWTETILYSFKSGIDGYYPWGDLVFDRSGNLYGATQFGGGQGNTCNVYFGGNCGTVFKLTPPRQKSGAWTEQVLHSFASGMDGAIPNGGLVLDSKGAIYGTTGIGGNQLCNYGNGQIGCGIVFQLSPPKKKDGTWTEAFLHRFTDGNDGAGPSPNLILRGKGEMYGTTFGGGQFKGGVVFRLVHIAGDAWKEEPLYEFPAAGYWPGISRFDSRGRLYGATSGYPGYSGSIFLLTHPTQNDTPWIISFLYKFMGRPDGISPYPTLGVDKQGDLYGATQYGGSGNNCSSGCGMVFEITP
jgi:hypothetical protein